MRDKTITLDISPYICLCSNYRLLCSLHGRLSAYAGQRLKKTARH
jgi:hypothetical protein